MSAWGGCSIYFNNTHQYHKVEDFKFELAELRAANVRDQIVRATYLTQSLLHDALIGPEKPLLVLGGGAAGMSCAMIALHEGITVCIVEKEKELFTTQLNITSRRIDPVEFDWPQAHWEARKVPLNLAVQFPLLFEGGIAGDVAAGWSLLADEYEEKYFGKFFVFFNQDARNLSYETKEGGIYVKELQNSIPPHPTFGAVVSCIGFGNEVVHDINNRWRYKGEKFWANDRLMFVTAGITKKSTVKILISGAGDGAIQDVLRTLTTSFGIDLVQRLSKANVDSPTFATTFAAISKCCNDIDNMEWDSVLWGKHKSPDAVALQRWHEAYDQLIEKYWAKTPTEELDWQYQNVIRKDIQEENLKLTWLLSNHYFSVCYPLNRILVSWVTRLYARGSGKQLYNRVLPSASKFDDEGFVTIRGYVISQIQSSGKAHECGSRANCSGEEHRVYVAPSGEIDVPGVFLGTYHEIVIRHGVVPIPLFKGKAPEMHLRSIDIAKQVFDRRPPNPY